MLSAELNASATSEEALGLNLTMIGEDEQDRENITRKLVAQLASANPLLASIDSAAEVGIEIPLAAGNLSVTYELEKVDAEDEEVDAVLTTPLVLTQMAGVISETLAAAFGEGGEGGDGSKHARSAFAVAPLMVTLSAEEAQSSLIHVKEQEVGDLVLPAVAVVELRKKKLKRRGGEAIASTFQFVVLRDPSTDRQGLERAQFAAAAAKKKEIATSEATKNAIKTALGSQVAGLKSVTNVTAEISFDGAIPEEPVPLREVVENFSNEVEAVTGGTEEVSVGIEEDGEPTTEETIAGDVGLEIELPAGMTADEFANNADVAKSSTSFDVQYTVSIDPDDANVAAAVETAQSDPQGTAASLGSGVTSSLSNVPGLNGTVTGVDASAPTVTETLVLPAEGTASGASPYQTSMTAKFEVDLQLDNADTLRTDAERLVMQQSLAQPIGTGVLGAYGSLAEEHGTLLENTTGEVIKEDEATDSGALLFRQLDVTYTLHWNDTRVPPGLAAIYEIYTKSPDFSDAVGSAMVAAINAAGLAVEATSATLIGAAMGNSVDDEDYSGYLTDPDLNYLVSSRFTGIVHHGHGARHNHTSRARGLNADETAYRTELSETAYAGVVFLVVLLILFQCTRSFMASKSDYVRGEVT
eukprot:g120.t1